MTRNLKALGLAIMATLALSAVAASSASAVANFHSDSEVGTTFTGTTNTTHVFKAAGSTITCPTGTFEGTQAAKTATSLVATAVYSGCKVHILGFELSATVNMGGCAYEFTAAGTANVVNAPGKTCSTSPITYRVSNILGECDVKVGPQSNLEKVTYDGTTTSSKTADVVVTPEVAGIKGTATGGLCPEAGEFTNGEYSGGATTVKGYKDNGAGHTEANQVAVWVTHS